jgi:hypothetical protein
MVAALGEGRLSSDGGALLLAGAERHLQFAARLAEAIADDRDPARVSHGVADILHARILAIASGDEDANDPDALRDDRAVKPAGGRLPDTGQALCSQPTASRLEKRAQPATDRGADPQARGSLLRHRPDRTGARLARRRRCSRCRARPVANVVLRRALRHALHPADPCLRHRHDAAGRSHPAQRQDAARHRAARPRAPRRFRQGSRHARHRDQPVPTPPASDPLPHRGHDRSHPPDRKQVCIALSVTYDGVPLGFEGFPCTADDSLTGTHMVATMEARHGVGGRVWIADRAMASKANLAWLHDTGRRYIIGAPNAHRHRFEKELADPAG